MAEHELDCCHLSQMSKDQLLRKIFKWAHIQNIKNTWPQRAKRYETFGLHRLNDINKNSMPPQRENDNKLRTYQIFKRVWAIPPDTNYQEGEKSAGSNKMWSIL